MPKAISPFSRSAEIYDTTIGWRFPNPQMIKMYTGRPPCRKPAKMWPEKYKIDRESQDRFCFALASESRCGA